MTAFQIAVVVAIVAACLIAFGGMCLWVANIAAQAVPARRGEDPSTIKERESFFVSLLERS